MDGLDDTVREWVDRRGFSGTVLVTRGSDTLFEGCYGLANRADLLPVSPRTRFGLASFTKMFTAVAIVGLMHDKGLSYATPVVDLLPPERRPSTLRGDVTVHHLLTHTSGIADYFEEADDAGGDYADLWVARPAYRMRRPVDFLPMFGDREPYRAPGISWQYSNAGYIVLGLVIEEIAAAAYIDVVQQRVLGPAGMTASGFFALDEAHPDVAVGHVPPMVEGGPWRTNVYGIPVIGGPDGGAFATAGDIDRFLRAYADGSLVGQELRDLMLTPHAQADPGIAFGYGTFLYDGPRWGHGGFDPGVEVFGHRVPDRDECWVVLCNVSGFTREIRDLLLSGSALGDAGRVGSPQVGDPDPELGEQAAQQGK